MKELISFEQLLLDLSKSQALSEKQKLELLNKILTTIKKAPPS